MRCADGDPLGCFWLMIECELELHHDGPHVAEVRLLPEFGGPMSFAWGPL